MIRSESPKRIAQLARLALVGMALGGLLASCSSTEEETAADLPKPSLSKPYKAPAARRSSRQPTLGRVVEENQRRRQVIRQLESIFQRSQP